MLNLKVWNDVDCYIFSNFAKSFIWQNKIIDMKLNLKNSVRTHYTCCTIIKYTYSLKMHYACAHTQIHYTRSLKTHYAHIHAQRCITHLYTLHHSQSTHYMQCVYECATCVNVCLHCVCKCVHCVCRNMCTVCESVYVRMCALCVNVCD